MKNNFCQVLPGKTMGNSSTIVPPFPRCGPQGTVSPPAPRASGSPRASNNCASNEASPGGRWRFFMGDFFLIGINGGMIYNKGEEIHGIFLDIPFAIASNLGLAGQSPNQMEFLSFSFNRTILNICSLRRLLLAEEAFIKLDTSIVNGMRDSGICHDAQRNEHSITRAGPSIQNEVHLQLLLPLLRLASATC